MLKSTKPLRSWLLFPFMSLIPFCLCSGCSPFFILTCRRLLKGIVFLAKKKKKKCAQLISHHHIIKLSRTTFCLLNPLHICVLIIDSLLYRQQNATKITEQCSKDGTKPSVRFDRLSRLITSWNTVEKKRKRGNVHSTPVPQKVFLC